MTSPFPKFNQNQEQKKVEVFKWRVVLRSYNNSNAQGGVAYANCNNDSSNTNANNGSRLVIIELSPTREIFGLLAHVTCDNSLAKENRASPNHIQIMEVENNGHEVERLVAERRIWQISKMKVNR